MDKAQQPSNLPLSQLFRTDQSTYLIVTPYLLLTVVRDSFLIYEKVRSFSDKFWKAEQGTKIKEHKNHPSVFFLKFFTLVPCSHLLRSVSSLLCVYELISGCVVNNTTVYV